MQDSSLRRAVMKDVIVLVPNVFCFYFNNEIFEWKMFLY